MTENYTAEDFAQANLATRDEYGVARRTDPHLAPPWHAYGSKQGYFSDEEMAADGWVPVVESGRLSLARLEAAWEAAEEADECREGDVLIIRDDEDNYLVRRMGDRYDLDSTARILSRAPQREPWQDLADVLLEDGLAFEEDVEGIVKRLHERGVRVTGGDDDE